MTDKNNETEPKNPYARIREMADAVEMPAAYAAELREALDEIERIVSLDALAVLAQWRSMPPGTRMFVTENLLGIFTRAERDMAQQEQMCEHGGLRTRVLVNRRAAEAFRLLGMLAFTWAKEVDAEAPPEYTAHFRRPSDDVHPPEPEVGKIQVDVSVAGEPKATWQFDPDAPAAPPEEKP